jgi:hypothetical protein
MAIQDADVGAMMARLLLKKRISLAAVGESTAIALDPPVGFT